jgi:polyisoprenoid-binding protein YceI
MTSMLRIVVLLAIATGLTACPAARRPEEPPSATTVPARPVRDYSGARVFQVVSAESLVRILAYRGGTLASSGHNHVIASHDLAGKVYVHQQVARSGFELTMPVASLEVDPPELRQEEGADFASVPSESAKQGTRKNMLSAALLDGERFPDVSLVATAVEGTRESPLVSALIGVRGRQYEIRIPVAIRYDGPRLVATGEFTVKQTDLGLTPFSALLGALQVRDELKVKFNVVARSD